MARCRQFAVSAQTYYPLRLLVERVCEDLQSKDYLSEILACYYWYLANTRYMNDPRNVELVRSPREVIDRVLSGRRPSLDCDDAVATLALMMLMLGREVRILTVAWKHAFYGNERQYQHVYVMVREPRSSAWLVLDPVAAEDTSKMLRQIVAAKVWPIA